jgi:hypothetical protein
MFKSRILPVCLILLAVPNTVLAMWPTSPGLPVPVCTQPGNQNRPTGVSDGANGLIAAWVDYRAGLPRIYATRILARGFKDPSWPSPETPVCTAMSAYMDPMTISPQTVSDGAGGAIIAWADTRNGGSNIDIYAQHVLASGLVDASWPVDGRLVCGATGNQFRPTIVSDGAGGAVIAWVDLRGLSAIYAQHLKSNGVIDPAWTVDGVLVSSQIYSFAAPQSLADGSGGALVLSVRNDGTLRLQHLMGTGAIDPTWTPLGFPVANGSLDFQAKMVSSGTGAIVIWKDVSAQILALRITAAGLADANWPAGGRSICTNLSTKRFPAADKDATGGAIIAWEDFRSSPYWDVFSAHVRVDGSMDPSWPPDGKDLTPNVQISTAGPTFPFVRFDGFGAVIAWTRDDRFNSGAQNMYAVRILQLGFLDPQWPVDGRLLCSTPNGQEAMSLVLNAGSVTALWEDYQVSQNNVDIYCQRVQTNGQLGGGAITITVPTMTISELLHSYQPPSQFNPNAISSDYAQFGSSAFDVSPFTAIIAPYDTVLLRFQPPPGMRFAIHRPLSVLSQKFSVQAVWDLPDSEANYVDQGTTTFENLHGSQPVEFNSVIGVLEGRSLVCTKEFHSNAFDCTAVQVRIVVTHSYTPVSWTFTPTNLFCNVGASASTLVDAYHPVLTLESLASVAVPETPIESRLLLHLVSGNPIHGTARLNFLVPNAGQVHLDVFDISGRHVARLEDGPFNPGRYDVTWNGMGKNGPVNPGIYFIRYTIGAIKESERVILLR